MNNKRMLTLVSVVFFLSTFFLTGAEIHDAALNGDLAKVKELLAKDPSLLDAGNDIGRTPLHLAANRDHLELAAWLLKRGADVNRRENSYQLTPLHLAVWGGHLETARLLLKNGANLQAREKDNETVLYYVKNSLPLAKFLVAKGLKMNDKESSAGNTPLSIALSRGYMEVAEYLLASGADALFKGRNGWTTLHMACWSRSKNLFELLIKRGSSAQRQGKVRLYAIAAGHDDRQPGRGESPPGSQGRCQYPQPERSVPAGCRRQRTARRKSRCCCWRREPRPMTRWATRD